jgi:hypothetical protein
MHKRRERIAEHFETPLLAAAALTIPATILQLLPTPDPWRTIADVVNWVLWLVFVAELVVMLAVVRSKWGWLRGRPLEVAIAGLTPPLLARVVQSAMRVNSPKQTSSPDLRARLLDAQKLVQQELRLLVEQRALALNEEVVRREEAAACDVGERRAAGEARRWRERTAPLRASADAICQQAGEVSSRKRQVPRINGGGRTS